jgi:hypothetical protein
VKTLYCSPVVRLVAATSRHVTALCTVYILALGVLDVGLSSCDAIYDILLRLSKQLSSLVCMHSAAAAVVVVAVAAAVVVVTPA